MGRLTDDMTRLRGEVNAIRGAREVFINDLTRSVSEMKVGVKEMQAGFHNNHAEMARNLRDALGTFVSGLKGDVSAMKAGFNADHAEMARNLRDALGGFVSDLKGDVSEMKAGFNADHAEMARNLRDVLGGFVSDLKGDVSEMKAGFNEDHAEMARNLRDALGTFVSGLKDTVGGMRKEFADDIAGARQAWSGPLPAEPKVIIKDKAEAPPEDEKEFRIAEEPQFEETGSEVGEAETFVGKTETVEAEEAEIGEELIPDDFTEIKGIGEGRQKLLNEAGYYTFAQLAESTPEKLREILGESARSANVENWIEDARDLAD